MNVFSSIIKNEKAVKIIFVIGITLIIVIFMLDTFGQTTDKIEEINVTDELSAYEEQLEEELADLIGKISGAGEIYVMITLENSEETVYSDRDDISTVITPIVRGAVVISSGSTDVIVKQKISESVSKALGISINKICVTY